MTTSSFSHRPARSWIRITIEVDPGLTDAVATFLSDLTGGGTEISSLGSSSNPPDLQKKLPDTITGYMLCDKKGTANELEDLHSFLDDLHSFFPGCTAPRLAVDTIQEEDWGKTWKEFFTAYQITPRLEIRPSWEKADLQYEGPKKDVLTIEMDPGLAFGTGHHASTQIALSLIDQLYMTAGTKPEKVLDVGTGSGILAMACALLGARQVLAIDNDPDAVETARDNIAINRLQSIITVNAADISALLPSYDLIAANITHDTLEKLAPDLIRLLAPKGHLILSGILQGSQEHSMINICTGLNLVHLLTEVKEEWVGLKFVKA